ncbi:MULTISPECIES: permease-like cell division protein FtsX [Brevibacillus]|jgi:cell division transport system permease protein|uniref:Cell division protein FtsX n=1 Tax=Brevibacillus borstelensis AK1 TaxID=1300222 RepID=M8DYV5_9BACL|nr:permease-like cell division protein FtsX [Brevibacillus borstelensis]EMT52206.1 cell division protein FtsX [Brevibacillus borstelensis AK1]KKX54655.1 cell division protein FtsX [Brevibacillus borstelensis cifa_chp40]MBE5396840.1 ABC transporter permease [Brevibacillus borstelensis]MCC0566234.1 permease-like cell division protein FtsX [Brevibacillus borstelensis]MCM3470944.1 permease-like cell division protein FtsX [Brevibacillus borstelensis]
MKIRTLGRHAREGVKNLVRNGWMTFASISAVTITLLILGVFLILAMNVNFFAQNVEKQVEIRVFIDTLATKDNIASLEQNIKSIPKVASVQFIPKDEGLKQLRESMGEKAYLFEGMDKENPLPDAFVVKTKLPQETAAVASELKKLEFVSSINYGEGTVEKLFAATGAVRNVGIGFIIGLGFTAMFLIANTIKLTIVARRREIEIMKLVGATNWFIRWPFFVEGLLMGIMGALIPIVILIISYHYLVDAINGSLIASQMFQLLPLFPLVYQVALALLAIGAFIGIWGSLVSVRRFLRV